MMLFRSILFISILTVFSAGFGQVTVQFNPGVSTSVTLEQLWAITLNNQYGQDVEVVLRGEIQKGQQRIYQAQSKPLVLGAGPTRLSMNNFPGLDVLMLDNFSQGELKSGLYTLCVEVMNTKKEALDKACRDMSVIGPRPPVLVFPFDDDQLSVNFPTFSWLPPAPVRPGQIVTYSLRIVEGNESSYISGPEVFFTENIPSNSLAYPSGAAKLQTDKRYAWQVEAFSGGVSLGKSEVWNFHFGQPAAKMASTQGRPFIKLQSRLGAGYCYAREEIRFQFDCPYGEKNIGQHLCIKDQDGKLMQFEKELVRQSGTGQFVLPLPPGQGFQDQQYYILEVKDDKGLKRLLRFKYLKS